MRPWTTDEACEGRGFATRLSVQGRGGGLISTRLVAAIVARIAKEEESTRKQRNLKAKKSLPRGCAFSSCIEHPVKGAKELIPPLYSSSKKISYKMFVGWGEIQKI